jgi:hypothetical protein
LLDNYIITPATNNRKSHRSFRQSALLAKSLYTTRLGCDSSSTRSCLGCDSSSTRSCMRGFAASYIDGNPRRFVPTTCCRGNNINVLQTLWIGTVFFPVISCYDKYSYSDVNKINRI